MNWDLARLIWEIFVSLVAAGSCLIAWQASRHRVTLDQLDALDLRQDRATQRLDVVETNRSNLIHAGVALALMAVIAGSFLWTGAGHWVGALAAIFFFYGREMRDHQRERQSAGKGHRNNFNRGDAAPWTWKQDSFMDLALPTAACLTAALAVEIAWALP